MMKARGLIILDRDGVLNSLVIDEEQGTIDSPLHPQQVQIFPWVPEALLALQNLGYGLSLATNQPAAAKGKTTKNNLLLVQDKVLTLAEGAGAKILSPQICWHQASDHCSCLTARC